MALSSLPSFAHGDDVMQLVEPEDAVVVANAADDSHQQKLRGGGGGGAAAATTDEDHQEKQDGRELLSWCDRYCDTGCHYCCSYWNPRIRDTCFSQAGFQPSMCHCDY